MKILCVFGKNQYGDAQRGESTESFSFLPALRTLGHDVNIFDSWNKSLHQDYAALNMALVERCQQQRPELLLWVALTVEVWLDTLDYLRSTLDIRVIHWAPDDSWKFLQHSRFVAPHVDLCVTTYPELLLSYQQIGTKAIVSGWAIPEHWRGDVVPSSECSYDVSFVGTAQPARQVMVRELRNRGVDVTCFGHGWPSGAVSPEQIPEIFRQSRISLNFSNSSGANQIKARVFEVTGAGGLLLTQTAPGMDRFFNLDHEVVVFNDIDECVNLIQRYLHDPVARDRIAIAGNRRTLAEYTYVERLNAVLSDLPLNVSTTIRSHPIDFDAAVQKHSKPLLLRLLARVLIMVGMLIFGRQRGPRFARRFCFELSWRLVGSATYKSSGVVGRMFYEQ